MIVKALELEQFRNYIRFQAEFHPRVNLIYGENAQGKTNLLEAIAYLSSARSHRARYDRELIQFGVDHAFVKAEVSARGRDFTLEAKLFRDLLGEGTTNVGGSSSRKHNVKLSAQACNGVILMPGEVFSYNNTTGSRSASKGYLAAPVYSGDASVDEVGGGICQTSSTIYYAVLHTNLKIVERRAHRFNTGYVPEGMDATVYYGQTDFRFENSTDYPIKIVTSSYDQGGKRKLNVKIYGTNVDGVRAEPKSTVYETVTPTTQYKADESIPRGTTKVDSKQNPYTGKSAQTYRYVYDRDGKLLEKQDMGKSVYKMRPKTILYNPADGDPATWPNGVPPVPEVPPAETVPETPAENAGAETPLEDPGTEAPAESGGGQELPPAEEPPAQDLTVDDPAQAV